MPIDRRTLLKGVGAVAVGGGVPLGGRGTTRSGAGTGVRSGGQQEALASHLRDATDHYRWMYYQFSASDLLDSVRQHLALVAKALRRVSNAAARRSLLSDASVTGLLAGRMLHFDLGRTGEARTLLNAALDDARELDDSALTAAVVGHGAFIAARSGRHAAAADHLDHARRFAQASGQNTLSAWVLAADAELSSAAGNEPRALTALNHARELVDDGSDGTEPRWLDWLPGGRIEGFAGHTYLALGRWQDARAALGAAERAEDSDSRQRAVYLADVATAHLLQGDLDAASALSHRALDVAAAEEYATAIDRVRHVAALAADLDPAAAVGLRDRIAAVA